MFIWQGEFAKESKSENQPRKFISAASQKSIFP